MGLEVSIGVFGLQVKVPLGLILTTTTKLRRIKLSNWKWSTTQFPDHMMLLIFFMGGIRRFSF